MTARPRRSWGALTAVGVAAALAIAGCASPTGRDTAAAAGAAAAGPVPLVVYSAEGYDAPVTKAFTAATGIPVSLVDDSTGPLLTKVAAEKNNPQWGVLWADGDTAFAALDQQGQLLPLHPVRPAERGR